MQKFVETLVSDGIHTAPFSVRAANILHLRGGAEIINPDSELLL